MYDIDTQPARVSRSKRWALYWRRCTTLKRFFPNTQRWDFRIVFKERENWWFRTRHSLFRIASRDAQFRFARFSHCAPLARDILNYRDIGSPSRDVGLIIASSIAAVSKLLGGFGGLVVQPRHLLITSLHGLRASNFGFDS